MDVAILIKIKDMIIQKINDKLLIYVHKSLYKLKSKLKILNIKYFTYKRKKTYKRGIQKIKVSFLKKSILFKNQNILS